VALANLDIIERENLVGRAADMGGYLLARLQPLAGLRCVAEVRGVGLMLGVELTGGDASVVQAGCRRRGVIVRATGQKIVLSPPLVITGEQADRIAGALAAELHELERGA
jgi:putrescine aminotransferase